MVDEAVFRHYKIQTHHGPSRGCMSTRMNSLVCLIVAQTFTATMGASCRRTTALESACAFGWNEVEGPIYDHVEEFFGPNRPAALEAVCARVGEDSATVLFDPGRRRAC